MSAPKHAPLVYHRAAMTHAVQIAAPAVVMLTALFTLSLALAFVSLVVAEGILLVAVPRMRVFRRDVDGRIEESERMAVLAERTRIFGLMSQAHVAELTELERLAAAMTIDRVAELEPLLASYARLSVAHRRSTEMFSPARWLSLEARASDMPFTAGGDAWIMRRRSILSIRRETWIRARIHREQMQHALATIADVVHWLHELSVMPKDDSGHADVEAVLAVCSSALADVRRLESDLDDVGAPALAFRAPVIDYQLACG